MNGIERISAERQRQIEVEGWSPEHDEQHQFGELSGAATAYAQLACHQIGTGQPEAWTTNPPAQTWRWSFQWWKPSVDPIRNLEKAGALIAAEIDRLQAEDLT